MQMSVKTLRQTLEAVEAREGSGEFMPVSLEVRHPDGTVSRGELSVALAGWNGVQLTALIPAVTPIDIHKETHE